MAYVTACAPNPYQRESTACPDYGGSYVPLAPARVRIAPREGTERPVAAPSPAYTSAFAPVVQVAGAVTSFEAAAPYPARNSRGRVAPFRPPEPAKTLPASAPARPAPRAHPAPRPARGVPRLLRVSPAADLVAARRAPAEDAELGCLQKPGALLFSTGRTEGSWIEVLHAHLSPGWVPASTLVPCEEAGWHGDEGERTGAGEALLQWHPAVMLQVELPDPAPNLAAGTPCGRYTLERNAHQARVFIPDGRRDLPLLLVLHGSKGHEWDFDAYADYWRDAAGESLQAVAVVVESLGPTWDFIWTGQREDMDFIEFALAEAQRLCGTDRRRVAVMGMSDGGSLGVSIALRNPYVFQAALVQATGFMNFDPDVLPPGSRRPKIFMEYGMLDRLFDFQRVALPNYDRLREAGYDVEFRGAEGVGHQPRPAFFTEALRWWISLPALGSVEDQGEPGQFAA